MLWYSTFCKSLLFFFCKSLHSLSCLVQNAGIKRIKKPLIQVTIATKPESIYLFLKISIPCIYYMLKDPNTIHLRSEISLHIRIAMKLVTCNI